MRYLTFSPHPVTQLQIRETFRKSFCDSCIFSLLFMNDFPIFNFFLHNFMQNINTFPALCSRNLFVTLSCSLLKFFCYFVPSQRCHEDFLLCVSKKFELLARQEQAFIWNSRFLLILICSKCIKVCVTHSRG